VLPLFAVPAAFYDDGMSRALQFTLLIVATLAGGCQPQSPESTLTGRTMGTTYTVQVSGCSSGACKQEIARAIDVRLQELENRFSHYRANSELSRFNQHASTEWFPVAPEFASLALMALEVSRLSEGAFDITVAPAVNGWGFGPDDPVGNGRRPPDDASVRQTRQRIDYRQLRARTSPPALRKANPSLTLDMSAIAKGYAVDQLAYLLEAAGYQNFLIEIGGELRAAGSRPDGRSWRIAIEAPEPQLEIEFIVQPGNNAVATSGDYRNFFEHNGIRYSHAMDPTTGRPVDNHLAAVSVIAPSAAQADALATALLVMGLERGQNLATRHNIAALFIERDGSNLVAHRNEAFSTYLVR